MRKTKMRNSRLGRFGVSSSLLALLGVGLLSGCGGAGGGGGGIGIDTSPGPPCETPVVLDNQEWMVQTQDSAIPEEAFEVSVNGQVCGTAKQLVFTGRVGSTSQPQQVLLINSAGYLRLKAGADPRLPFGQSLVLGPAIFGTSSPSFPDTTTLFFNPKVQRVSISTSGFGADEPGALFITLIATDTDLPPQSTHINQIMHLNWLITLYRPADTQTRIDVDETFSFTENITLDPGRTAEFQSFRLVQISSSFIDETRQAVDALRYRDAQGRLVELFYTPDQAGRLLPEEPAALDPAAPLDSLDTDNRGGPSGNTPSYRIYGIQTDGGLLTGPLVPRAFLAPADNGNEDNLGVWIHQTPSQAIMAGMAGGIQYSVIATPDPLPEP